MISFFMMIRDPDPSSPLWILMASFFSIYKEVRFVSLLCRRRLGNPHRHALKTGQFSFMKIVGFWLQTVGAICAGFLTHKTGETPLFPLSTGTYDARNRQI